MQTLILGKTVAITKEIMIQKNLVIHNAKNVILMNSFALQEISKQTNKQKTTKELLLN